MTAANRGRSVFARMLKSLERGNAHRIIIHRIDRSARNLRDWADLADLIDRGAEIHFAHDDVDLRSRGGRLSADNRDEPDRLLRHLALPAAQHAQVDIVAARHLREIGPGLFGLRHDPPPLRFAKPTPVSIAARRHKNVTAGFSRPKTAKESLRRSAASRDMSR